MDDTNNPFGTFQPQPAPTFEPVQTSATTGPTQVANSEPSPKRKSRRSKRTAAAPTTASSAKPKRKYTRQAKPAAATAKAEPSVSLEALVLFRNLSEPEYNAVRALMKLGPDSTARIFAALQAVLPK